LEITFQLDNGDSLFEPINSPEISNQNKDKILEDNFSTISEIKAPVEIRKKSTTRSIKSSDTRSKTNNK
jgi:hypothetical protein